MNYLIVSAALWCLLTVTTSMAQKQSIAHFSDLDYETEGLLETYDSYVSDLPEDLQINKNDESNAIEETDATHQTQVSPAARSLQDFAFDIFNSIEGLKPNQDNTVISPLSIYSALSMLKQGLSGNSLTQVDDVINRHSASDADVSRMHEAIFSKQARQLLRHASRVYFDNSIKLRKSYKKSLKRLNFAQARKTDFGRNAEKSRVKMNKYVKNRTKKLIRDFVPEGGVSSATKVYLLNALYLKAKWNFRFSSTKPRRFRVNAQETISVPTMTAKYSICTNQEDKVLNAKITVLALGDDLSMIIAMPKQPGNFSSFYDDEHAQMKKKMSRLFNKIWPAEENGERMLDVCDLALPKFKISHQTDLVENLMNMGIIDVFDASVADFSRMSKRSAENLHLGDVRHKSVLDVNEDGVEGAGASGVDVAWKSPQTVRVKIDKPFLFAIRHDKTGAILFLGKVTRPISDV
ncbi:unnamed protein product [Clavelina lepadiformis]|uniref:Serpin domain-containing protein n=1 Tax=Clavelina lepadiformis TaxID=159417 RepID=A0ABP0GM04_CLALP